MALLDSNTYYKSKDITIFPSSNAVDSGKLFTEFNGRNITINITDLNYVVSPNPEGYAISYNNTTNKIIIAPGKAIINGFEVITSSAISYSLPVAGKEYSIVSEGEYNGYYLLCLHTLFDSLDNLSGNIQVGSTWYCSGIQITYVSKSVYEANPNEYLLLGGVKSDGTIKPNKDRFQRLDAKHILVKLESDSNTGVPPTQTTDLLTFINNYLKSYWVSKSGDNEYGQIVFKTERPNGYLQEGFDHNLEDPLTSSKFGLKLVSGIITVKDEAKSLTANDTITEIIKDGIIGSYHGAYKSHDNDTKYSEYLKMSKPTSSGLKNASKLELVSRSGSIRLSTEDDSEEDNTNISLYVENRTDGSGYNTGNIIYTQRNTGITTKNYLYDGLGNIRTLTPNIGDIALQSNFSKILIQRLNNGTNNPSISFRNSDVTGNISLVDDVSTNWKNIIQITDNTKTENLQTTGFIISGDTFTVKNEITNKDEITNDPTKIKVPDVANGNSNRNLQSGDIYGRQVWSAVYNDIAEIFDISDILVRKEITKLLLAVDNSNPTKYTLADKDNTCVVGVVSENPAFCAGGDDCKHGVPVALCGRVEVKYQGKKPKIGDYVGINKKVPGYVTKCKHNSKYRCGKIIDIIDNSTVKILVLL